MNDLGTTDGLTSDLVKATPGNIRRLWEQHEGNLFAIDPETGEESSVNPGDYAFFADCDDDEELFGGAVLALRRPGFMVLTADEDEDDGKDTLRLSPQAQAIVAGFVDRDTPNDEILAVEEVWAEVRAMFPPIVYRRSLDAEGRVS